MIWFVGFAKCIFTQQKQWPLERKAFLIQLPMQTSTKELYLVFKQIKHKLIFK